MPTLQEVLGPEGGPSRSFCRPVSSPPGDPMNTASLLAGVGKVKLLVSNGRFVGGGGVICGMLVDVKIGRMESVVDCDVEVLDVLESVAVSDSDDVVEVSLELLVRAAGGAEVGAPIGGVVGDDEDFLSSSSSSSSGSSAFVFSLSSSSSSLFINETTLSNVGVCRSLRMFSPRCMA
jgi:hypothetical protein